MIRFLISNGKNSLKIDIPTNELPDHLQSIGISEDIPIGGTEKISIERFPKDDKIAEIVCERLLPDDRISDVNQLCKRLDGQWLIGDEELEKALVEQNIRGAKNICEAFDELKMSAEQEICEMKM